MTEQAGNIILFLFQSKQICLINIESMCFRLKNRFKAEKKGYLGIVYLWNNKVHTAATEAGFSLIAILPCNSSLPEPKAQGLKC